MAFINNSSFIEPSSELYDADLVREIKKFQLVEGLVPDGIVGPLTLLHINTAVFDDIPTLSGTGRKN
jgi:murein L,D-transpeptidase YcbB/YkuD